MANKKKIADFITKDSMMNYIKKTYKKDPSKLEEETKWFYEVAYAPVSVNMNSVIVEFLNRYNPTIVIK